MDNLEASTFRDPSLPVRDRVEDLLGRLTLAEKTALLHQHQPAIPRLGIESFRTGTEALHGLAWLGPATVFPQAVGLASTWNPVLVRAVGDAVGDETRGFHHKDPARGGLNVWAPVVNQLRDPRWGRNEEGYAEDPLLTGIMATAYAGGLRGDHPRLLKTAPTLKHFLGYNNETRREMTSSNLGPRVLREYELPAFRMPIAQGAAVAVMASYNFVNGRPAHLSPLINADLRSWTDDDILLVSDAAAPTNVATTQAYYPDHVASHAAMVRAGVDSFTDNDDRPELTVARLTEALEAGLLTEADIDTAARRVLAIRTRLGEFDPAPDNPYAAITEDVINCPAHQELAREVARQSLVLLKNADQTLPLSGRPRVAVLGPLADTLYEDWYSGTLPYAVTARRGLAERLGAGQVDFVEGVDRVAVRVNGDYVVAGADPGGAALRVSPAADVETGTKTDVDTTSAAHVHTFSGAAFDVVDWGNGVKALRAVANGRHVTVDDTGHLVNDQALPNGWVVRETFRFDTVDTGETVIHHIASGRYVAVAADGSLRASAERRDEATGFSFELLSSGRAEAVRAARAADVAIVVVGNHPLINGRETEDRVDLDLPPAQEELVRAVRAANPSTVLVVQSSYPYAISWAERHVPAIVWSSHGGQEFGRALADVLFGDTAPAGRLTQTWYAAGADLPDLLDYDIIEADATYLYYRGTPLYPFGHGLSYTTFTYSDLRLSQSDVDAGGVVEVDVTVRNTGSRAGDEVVQVYTRQRHSRVKQPLRQLRGFERIHLEPKEQTHVRFTLDTTDLGFWDVTRDRFVVESARHSVLVGRSCTDIQQAATLAVRGEEIPPRDPSAGPIAAVSFDHYAGVDIVDAGRGEGDAVSAAEPYAWIAFDTVDFGSPGSLDLCAGRISAIEPGIAEVTLRLDDPWQGPIVAALSAHCEAGRYDWSTVSGQLHDAAGIHDLYVIFPAAGVRLESLTFAQR